MGAENELRGRNAENDVVNVKHNPIGGTTNCHAVVTVQAATAGLGSALFAASDNPSAPAAIIKGAGALLDLKNSAGTSQLSVAQDGTITATGLGTAASRSVGTTAGTVAAGDDSRITGAAQKANNLSDLASAATARTNLGFGTDIVGQTRAVYKTADEQVTSSIALQDDNHLFMTVTANGVYTLDMYLDADGDTAGDLLVGWTVPSGTTMSWTENSPSLGNTNNISSIKTQRLSAAGSSGIGIIVAGSTASPRGVVIVSSTGGTLQFQWAQNASSGTATTLKLGSWLRLHRIA